LVFSRARHLAAFCNYYKHRTVDFDLNFKDFLNFDYSCAFPQEPVQLIGSSKIPMNGPERVSSGKAPSDHVPKSGHRGTAWPTTSSAFRRQ
jgi:hypothetical protein